ncbi:MAG: hypothetical protein BAA02_13025 [Paenibacillaceae bacterium ZCTH02-B3]|nr:MAG: hypothetical protein BAA02_13025 [Paenibacillaceae bacterium ZCTH02-B3]
MSNNLEDLVSHLPYRKVTTQEWVTDILRTAILKGYYQAGEPIETAELAAKLNVSRMPIRIALRELAKEGLVAMEPHRKPVAARLNPDEVWKICDIRCELEALSIRKAISKINDDHLKQLFSLVRKMDNIKDIDEYIRLNNEFHNIINTLSGNEFLLGMINQLRNNVERYLRVYLFNYRGAMHSANVDHHEIIKAIETKDEKLADQVIRQHLYNTTSKVSEFLEQLNGR